MGYRIRYSQTLIKENLSFNQDKKRTGVVFLYLTVVCIILYVVYSHHGSLLTIILPGDPVITKAAMMGFVSRVWRGESVFDAITAFCFEVIDGAGFS